MMTIITIVVLGTIMIILISYFINRSEKKKVEKVLQDQKELIYHALGTWYDSYKKERPEGILWNQRDAELATICDRMGLNTLLALKDSGFKYRDLVSYVKRPE